MAASKPVGLLHTKLMPPRLSAGMVPREHLLARLDEGLSRKVSLVSAPTGFGKTTLVHKWIASREVPSAWVTLDDHDNDPVRFWTYVCSAHLSASGRKCVSALSRVAAWWTDILQVEHERLAIGPGNILVPYQQQKGEIAKTYNELVVSDRGGCDPFLSVCELRDLFDQQAIGDHSEHPRLFVPARGREPRGFKHFLDDIFGDRSLWNLRILTRCLSNDVINLSSPLPGRLPLFSEQTSPRRRRENNGSLCG